MARVIFSPKLRFPVSMTSDGEYIVKVGWNLQQGEVWLPMDGRQIEKHIRDILKREEQKQ
jgi:hypothetical protein